MAIIGKCKIISTIRYNNYKLYIIHKYNIYEMNIVHKWILYFSLTKWGSHNMRKAFRQDIHTHYIYICIYIYIYIHTTYIHIYIYTYIHTHYTARQQKASSFATHVVVILYGRSVFVKPFQKLYNLFHFRMVIYIMHTQIIYIYYNIYIHNYISH